MEQNFRGKGVYKGLYLHLKEVAQNHKDVRVRGLRLYVDKTNQIAQKVYRALGMSDEHYDLFEWMTPETVSALRIKPGLFRIGSSQKGNHALSE